MADVLVGLGIAATLSAMSLAELGPLRDRVRAAAAGRFLASVFHAARLAAVQRGQAVGVRFDEGPEGYGWTVYADGNGNGVRTADIASGADIRLCARTSMPDTVPGVNLGATAGVPQVDSSAAVGDDPVRLGASDILSFSPDGTATSGTVYLVGRGGHDWAIRVLGATARIRLSRFDPVRREWIMP
jgi:hypothetical protein